MIVKLASAANEDEYLRSVASAEEEEPDFGYIALAEEDNEDTASDDEGRKLNQLSSTISWQNYM